MLSNKEMDGKTEKKPELQTHKHAKGLSTDKLQQDGKPDLKLDSAKPAPDLSRPPKRGENFKTLKLNFKKGTPTPPVHTSKDEFRVHLALKADDKAPFIDPCVLLHVFLNVAQKHDSNFCLYPYDEKDTRNPVQCPDAVPTDIEETQACLCEKTTKGKEIQGYVKIVSQLTFGQLKTRLIGWLHNFGHYMAFVGIKSTNPVQVAFLVNSHPQNTNLHQLSTWMHKNSI